MKIPEGHLIGVINQEAFRNAILIENEDIGIDWPQTIAETGLTNEDLAMNIGISEVTIQKWKSGQSGRLPGYRSLMIGWLIRNNYKIYLTEFRAKSNN